MELNQATHNKVWQDFYSPLFDAVLTLYLIGHMLIIEHMTNNQTYTPPDKKKNQDLAQTHPNTKQNHSSTNYKQHFFFTSLLFIYLFSFNTSKHQGTQKKNTNPKTKAPHTYYNQN